jgi:hypothetical protein
MKVRAVRSEVATVFAPLMRPARYKGAYGGRAGAKSHFFGGRALLRLRPTIRKDGSELWFYVP